MKCTADFLEISYTINENTLKISIDPKVDNTNDYCWRVEILGPGEGFLKKRWEFSTERTYTWTMNNPGRYGIFVIAKNIDGTIYFPARKSVLFHDDAIKESYSKFMNNADTDDVNTGSVPLYCPPSPFQNIALVTACNDKRKQSLEKNIGKLQLISDQLTVSEFRKNESSLIVSLSQKVPFEKKILFSGRTKYDGKMVLGQDDLRNDMDFSVLFDEIGMWSSVYGDQNRTVFTNDYYGLSPLFYYDVDGLSIVSNNYHLLLLIMKNLGLEMKLDVEQTLPYLINSTNGLYEQRLSHHTDILNVFVIPVDKYAEIAENGTFRLRDKSIRDVFENPVEYDEKEYKRLLHQTALEIEENVEVALKDKRYDYYIVDLSGGKDSRTVLAAVNNVVQKNDEYWNKIVIQTYGVGADADTASSINRIFNYKYDVLPRSYEMKYLYKKEYRNRSFFMGQSYSRVAPIKNSYVGSDDAILLNFTGAGESNLRPYYSREGMALPERVFSDSKTTVEGIVDLYVNLSCEAWNICTNDKNAQENLKKMMIDTINGMPGRSVREKVDNLLPFFRNVYHFGCQSMMDSIEKIPQWQPLYAKSACKAFKMIYSIHPDIKFQMDLIAEMCPLLAVIPFESKMDNDDVSALKDELFLDVLYKNMSLDSVADPESLQKYRVARKNNNHTVNHQEEGIIEIANQKYWSNFYDRMLSMLKKLINFDKAYEAMGLDLYAYITSEKEKHSGSYVPNTTQFIFNKIASIVDQISIIE